MKRIISVLMLLVFPAVLMSGCKKEEKTGKKAEIVSVFEYSPDADYVESGTTDDGLFTYTVYSDHSEITGYSGDIASASVTVPDEIGGKPVAVIGTSVFEGMTKLTSVTLPKTLVEIGDSAFLGCSLLENIDIPVNVKKVGYCAFLNTAWLEARTDEFVTVGSGVLVKYNGSGKEVKIPGNVIYISDAFAENDKITDIKIPDSVYGISAYAFYNCGSLCEVSIPDSVTEIGYFAFDGTTWYLAQDEGFIVAGDGVLIGYTGNETEVTVPDNVKYVSGAFIDSEVTSVTFPDSVKYVSDSAFDGSAKLSSVVFEGADTRIGKMVFYNCSALSSVTLPSGLLCLGDALFYECTSLEEIKIPDGVKHIGSAAFYNCGLKTVELPKTLKTVGSGAFFGCTKLKEINVPESVNLIENHAFSCCYALENVILPESLTKIKTETFSYCKELKTVTLGALVRSVDTFAFSNCGKVKVTVKNAGTVFADDVFLDCTETVSIVCAEGSEAEKYAKANGIGCSYIKE